MNSELKIRNITISADIQDNVRLTKIFLKNKINAKQRERERERVKEMQRVDGLALIVCVRRGRQCLITPSKAMCSKGQKI